MSAIRKQIRQAVVDSLASISATIYESRVYPINVFPAVAVYTPTDERDEDDAEFGPTTDPRQLTITLELLVKASSEIEDALDDLCSLVIPLIVGDSALGALVEHIQHEGFDSTLTGEQDKPAGLGILTFTAYYKTAYNNPDLLA